MEKIGFWIINKTFVFKRMPFGLCNAPSTFQKAVNMLFNDVKKYYYLFRSFLVYTSIIEKHYETLKEIFNIIIDNNSSVNFEKSTLLNAKYVSWVIKRLDRHKT
ncbi:Retrovirus-related Pol polyprotein from transposon opus [Dictyocoela muelleri]|nr:Retrovirus-related Pol polyprotein from transposon opus [Dictyocoela muelleri]